MHVFPTFDASYCSAWFSMATSDLYLTYYDPFEFGFTTLNQKAV